MTTEGPFGDAEGATALPRQVSRLVRPWLNEEGCSATNLLAECWDMQALPGAPLTVPGRGQIEYRTAIRTGLVTMRGA